MTYLWFKIFHLVFMVAWFAGLFYIVRLFLYHIQNWEDANQRDTFEVMEHKLLFIIMYPAMILTVMTGLYMVARAPRVLLQLWFELKLAAVFGLIAYQLYATRMYHEMKAGHRPLSEKACRIINEVPTLLLFIIIIMVVIRPGTLT